MSERVPFFFVSVTHSTYISDAFGNSSSVILTCAEAVVYFFCFDSIFCLRFRPLLFLLHRPPLLSHYFVIASKRPQLTGDTLTVTRLARLAPSTSLAPLLRLSRRQHPRHSVHWTSDDTRPRGMREAIKSAAPSEAC